MSLIKQLWLALIVIMLLAFGGSFAISTLGARSYLEQQLYLKNQDNAASLALAMSQLDKDPVTLELLVGAHFDSGHYRQIRLVQPTGEVLVERNNPPLSTKVPEWFTSLIPIEVEPGVAQIQDGWRQFGTLTLLSHDRFAYQELWDESVDLALWFLGGLVVCGLIGSGVVRVITRPVAAVVGQAEAIGQRRFVTVGEPATHEFRRIVRAMNGLSGRVRTMLEAETERLEKLRRLAHSDPLTGLANREHFLAALESLLEHEQTSSGSLVIGRISGLDGLNRQLGRQVVDQLLLRIGTSLQQLAGERQGWLAGRLNGADFVLLAVESPDTLAVARELSAQLHLALDGANLEGERLLPVGGTRFAAGERISTVLSRADGALIMAERDEGIAIQVAEPHSHEVGPSDLVSWQQALTDALRNDGVRLAEYPVLGAQGDIVHFEAPVRLRLDGDWRPAAYFMPWVAKLDLLPELDRQVIVAALRELEASSDKHLAVHVSGEAIRSPGFRDDVLALLRRHSAVANRLWLEVPEAAAFRQLNAFRELCLMLKPSGCRIGLEHVGSQFSRISELQELGLDFIKIDGALIRGVQQYSSHEVFLRGLCTIAHAIGLLVMAEGVGSRSESAGLFELGFDAVTGPGVKV